MEDIENEEMKEKKLSLSYAERDNFQNDGYLSVILKVVSFLRRKRQLSE